MTTNARSLSVFSADYPAGDERGVQLSVVIPTHNHCEKLPVLIESIRESLHDLSYEIIVVDDDSQDGTWRIAEGFARGNPRISLIRRVNRKGLSSATLEGFLLGKGKYLVALDAESPLDEGLVRGMLTEIAFCDIVVGSRYMNGNSSGEAGTKLGRTSNRVAQKLLRQDLTDPMSGSFMVHREIIHDLAPQLFSDGCKVLVDILLKRPDLKVREIPRETGEVEENSGKLNTSKAFELADIFISRAVPSQFNLQFVRFGMVGASGVGVHFVVLYLLHALWRMRYPLALIIAIEAAMLSNYVWNNEWTFKDSRFFGAQWWSGLFKYNLACLMGTAYNLAIGWYLVAKGIPWVAASALGIWVGVSWNFLANRAFTWGR